MKKKLVLLSVVSSLLLVGCGKKEHPTTAKKVEIPAVHKEPTAEEKETIIFDGKFSNCENVEPNEDGVKACLISKMNVFEIKDFMKKRRIKVIDSRFAGFIADAQTVDPYVDFYYTDKQGRQRSLYIQQSLPISVIESQEKGLPVNVERILEFFEFFEQETGIVEKINFTFLYYRGKNVTYYVEIRLDAKEVRALAEKYRASKN